MCSWNWMLFIRLKSWRLVLPHESPFSSCCFTLALLMTLVCVATLMFALHPLSLVQNQDQNPPLQTTMVRAPSQMVHHVFLWWCFWSLLILFVCTRSSDDGAPDDAGFIGTAAADLSAIMNISCQDELLAPTYLNLPHLPYAFFVVFKCILLTASASDAFARWCHSRQWPSPCGHHLVKPVKRCWREK